MGDWGRDGRLVIELDGNEVLVVAPDATSFVDAPVASQVEVDEPTSVSPDPVPDLEPVLVEIPTVEFIQYETDPDIILVPVEGPRGPQGIAGDSVELFDSTSPPPSPPDTYLRFERDIDGDVQTIYLGTVT